MAKFGLRVGVVGATGAVGTELIEVLAASSIRVSELVPVATARSLGADIEFQGDVVSVETELPSLQGLDFIFLCAPRSASFEVVREALRAEVPGIDLSGALASTPELPLQVEALGVSEEEAAFPFVATPAGASLAWAHVLHPLAAAAGLVRVVGTVLESAAVSGVRGTEALMSESLALFNQQELPEPTVFSRPVAFDCGPLAVRTGEGGEQAREREVAEDLGRLLGEDVVYSVTAVQVPTFLGQASSLVLETRDPIDADEARSVLGKATGVAVWPDPNDGPSLRAAAGCGDVLVGRIRCDSSCENGLRLWIASDAPHLAAVNAVALAEARLGAR